jgi:hypothetical protein
MIAAKRRRTDDAVPSAVQVPYASAFHCSTLHRPLTAGGSVVLSVCSLETEAYLQQMCDFLASIIPCALKGS